MEEKGKGRKQRCKVWKAWVSKQVRVAEVGGWRKMKRMSYKERGKGGKVKKKVERRGHLSKWRWQKWVAEKGGRRRNVSGILDGWVASSLQLWWTWTHSSSSPLPSSSLPSWLASSLPLFSAPSSLPFLGDYICDKRPNQTRFYDQCGKERPKMSSWSFIMARALDGFSWLNQT